MLNLQENKREWAVVPLLRHDIYIKEREQWQKEILKNVNTSAQNAAAPAMKRSVSGHRRRLCEGVRGAEQALCHHHLRRLRLHRALQERTPALA